MKAVAKGEQIWQSDREILLAITTGDGYNQALQRLTQEALQRFGRGVCIAANRPWHGVRDLVGQDADQLRFVDCISGMTGFLPPAEDGVIFIESPTMLEKAALRAEQVLRRLERPAFMILDSLSTLAVYNGEEAVAELAHNLVTRLRMQQAPAALLLVDTQASPGLAAAIAPSCDRTIRL